MGRKNNKAGAALCVAVLLLLGACHRAANKGQQGTQLSQVKAWAHQAPDYSLWADRLGHGFVMTMETRWQVAPLEKADAQIVARREDRTEEVWLRVDGPQRWHLRYAVRSQDGTPTLGGEAMLLDGVYYRKLADVPWVQRDPEPGEVERLFAARHVLGALLDRAGPRALWSEDAATVLQGRPVHRYVLGLSTLSESVPDQTVHMERLSGELLWQAAAGVPLKAAAEGAWRVLGAGSTEQSSSATLRVSFAHKMEIQFPDTQPAMIAPQTAALPSREIEAHRDRAKLRAVIGNGGGTR